MVKGLHGKGSTRVQSCLLPNLEKLQHFVLVYVYILNIASYLYSYCHMVILLFIIGLVLIYSRVLKSSSITGTQYLKNIVKHNSLIILFVSACHYLVDICSTLSTLYRLALLE